MGSLVEAKMAGGKGGKGGNLSSQNSPAGFVNDIRRLRRRGFAPVRWEEAGRKPAETGGNRRKLAETGGSSLK